MSDDLLRLYEPGECSPKGYPLPWEKGNPRIPALVRELAEHRCIRCGHPYTEGQSDPEWSPCDDRCTHSGPCRVMAPGHHRNEVGWGPIDCAPTLVKAGRVEARYRVLTVHHLTGEKRDCRWWNLAALCQRCHLQIQGRVNMAQLWPHEHSEWFKPYAAGYYAFVYRGQELSREEVEAQLGELLALERMATA